MASRDGWRIALTVARCVVLALSTPAMTVLSILDDAAATVSALTVLLVLLESTVVSMSTVSPPAPFPHSAVRIVAHNTRR